MSAPAVTVCVLAYNHERYIHDCITSVVAQAEGLDVEVLVGDDQSTDGTPQIVADLAVRHPNVIRHIRHAQRLGGSGNHRFLLNAAAGDCIAHLDGDDYWLPGKLRAQLEFLAAHPGCAAVYTNALVIDEEGRQRGLFTGPQPELVSLDRLLQRGNFLNNSSMLFRRSALPLLLGIEGQFIDYQGHLRCARQGPVGYLNRPLTAYRAGSTSSILVHANDHIRELYWQALLDVPRELVSADALARGMADFLRRITFRSVRTGQPGMLLDWGRRVLAKAPTGNIRMLWLTACNVFVTAVELVRARASSALTGSAPGVLYP